jgi:uncharacterized protein YecT (DUF1311 family)
MSNLSVMKPTHRMKVALATTTSCALVFAGAAFSVQSAAADTVKVADAYTECLAKANTTPAIKACITAEQGRVDAELNQVRQQLVTKLDASEKALFVKAEQSWIAFREAECKFAASRFAGGSVAAVAERICLIDLTVQRTTDLRTHLAGPGL